MAEVRESIEVNVPVSTAYNQWTQFEEFPSFMEGVQSVTQIDDTQLRWVAEVGGKTHEWEAKIVETPGAARSTPATGRADAQRTR